MSSWRARTTARAPPAVIAPRYLGLRLVIAKSYARIHWQNLANFGVLATEFADPADYDRVEAGDELSVDGLTDALGSTAELTVSNRAESVGRRLHKRPDLNTARENFVEAWVRSRR